MRRIATLTAIAVAGITLAACEVEETQPNAATAPETVIPGEAKKDKPEKDQKRKAEEAPEPVSTPEPEPEPNVTLGEKNALGSAESYIDMSGFSREGLIKQLKFEGFSKSEAEFAADAVGANWREEAAESAESYMDMSSFSAVSLAEQVAFEGYTDGQVAYALNAVGY